MTPSNHDSQTSCPDVGLDTRLPVPPDGPADGDRDGDGNALDLSPDALFDVLATTRSRYVLYYLVDHGGTTMVDTVATTVTAWETETTADGISRDSMEDTLIDLVHATLPKLDDYGFVEYDTDEKVVTPTPRADDLEPFLEIARQLDGPEAEADGTAFEK
ncbi:hypothetical protein OB955_11275 [Halobacteria archaeon AArc-m2/3/4]|uniref:DUF7344 domain-containing protein n=1 Tax=Natronoglomus mannanivorans TaxID=2979990 RepID=A0ABT2QEG6_9EURY|nr:hypothetical protein [Halobacteria archaeon AArc-m2/3/4]